MANGNVKKYLNISCCKLLNKEEEDKNEMKTGKKKKTNKLISRFRKYRWYKKSYFKNSKLKS